MSLAWSKNSSSDQINFFFHVDQSVLNTGKSMSSILSTYDILSIGILSNKNIGLKNFVLLKELCENFQFLLLDDQKSLFGFRESLIDHSILLCTNHAFLNFRTNKNLPGRDKFLLFNLLCELRKPLS